VQQSVTARCGSQDGFTVFCRANQIFMDDFPICGPRVVSAYDSSVPLSSLNRSLSGLCAQHRSVRFLRQPVGRCHLFPVSRIPPSQSLKPSDDLLRPSDPPHSLVGDPSLPVFVSPQLDDEILGFSAVPLNFIVFPLGSLSFLYLTRRFAELLATLWALQKSKLAFCAINHFGMFVGLICQF